MLINPPLIKDSRAPFHQSRNFHELLQSRLLLLILLCLCGYAKSWSQTIKGISPSHPRWTIRAHRKSLQSADRISSGLLHLKTPTGPFMSHRLSNPNPKPSREADAALCCSPLPPTAAGAGGHNDRAEKGWVKGKGCKERRSRSSQGCTGWKAAPAPAHVLAWLEVFQGVVAA